jgi:membrane protease YdiL (CAAX protease family)
MLARLAAIVARYPFATFVALAYALAWWPALLAPGTLFPYAPSLAALIVLAVTAGRPGVVDLLRRMGRWRVGPGWYAVALGLPAAMTLLAVALAAPLGAPDPARLPDWPFLGATALALLAAGGQWEEPGWRGYAQPRLERGRPALPAALLLAAIGVGWRLPLMLAGRIPWTDVLFIPAYFIVLAWACTGAGGSVLIAMLLHFANNLAYALAAPLVAGADAARYGWLYAGAWWAAALAVVLLAGPARVGRAPRAARGAVAGGRPPAG